MDLAGRAIAFFAFGAWTLRGDSLTEDEKNKAQRAGGSAILAVGAAFFFAELGDKTMLATITLATPYGWFGTWVGSTVGMVAADALAIIVGRMLGKRLPEKAIRYGAATLFALFGVWLLVEAVVELTADRAGLTGTARPARSARPAPAPAPAGRRCPGPRRRRRTRSP